MAAPKNPQTGPNPKKAPRRNRTKEYHKETIEKIQASQIVNQLIKHVLGEVDMKPSQVTAGLGLANKILPNLSSAEFKGDADNPLSFVNRIELTSPNDDSSS